MPQVTAFRLDPVRLAALNPRLWGMRVGNFEFADDQLRLGDLQGNRCARCRRMEQIHYLEPPTLFVRWKLQATHHLASLHMHCVSRVGSEAPRRMTAASCCSACQV